MNEKWRRPLQRIDLGLGGGTLMQLANRSNIQMMSYMIETPDGRIVMIDGGNCRETPDGEFLLELLKEKGGHVSAWFITHAHDDHIGALVYILENAPEAVTIDRICWDLPPLEWLYGIDAAFAGVAERLMRAVERQGIPVVRLRAGDVLDVGVRVEIIRDGRDYMKYTDAYAINDTSVCMRVGFPRREVLFVGDIGAIAGDELLERCPDKLPCGIVQMAHHGQDGAKRSFYEAVRPEVCLWNAPDWLWENDIGGGRGSGPWKTLETRGWMEEMGVKQNYACAMGDFLFF